MTKTILKAKVINVMLPPSDAQSALERLLELQNKEIRARNKIRFQSIIHPANLSSRDYIEFKNNTGKPIPRDNCLFRFYPDGVEQLILAGRDGELKAVISYIREGMSYGAIYQWNLANGGMYPDEFDNSSMEVQWE